MTGGARLGQEVGGRTSRGQGRYGRTDIVLDCIFGGAYTIFCNRFREQIFNLLVCEVLLYHVHKLICKRYYSITSLEELPSNLDVTESLASFTGTQVNLFSVLVFNTANELS